MYYIYVFILMVITSYYNSCLFNAQEEENIQHILKIYNIM